MNLLAGGGSGLLVGSIVDPSWNAVIATLVGMVLGMLTAMPLSAAFMPLFGAFEVMMPGTLSGMVAGMLVAMTSSMRPLAGPKAMLLGAFAGVLSLSVVYLMTFVASKRGELGP